ncbi:hypothetical protein BU17DRAFT_63579 [Hysterangium stoloniferum]|nr:hypothetical protein BU17DRAFT_63579 [Hysterangium stoloniferum]
MTTLRRAFCFTATVAGLLGHIKAQSPSFPTCLQANWVGDWALPYVVTTEGTIQSPPPLRMHVEGVYDGPAANAANPCTCSSVTYSMVSACAVCQDGDVTLGISVPSWAYMDVDVIPNLYTCVKISHGSFDDIAAEAQSGQTPDSSAGPGPTSSRSPLSSGIFGSSITTTPGPSTTTTPGTSATTIFLSSSNTIGFPFPTTPSADSDSHHNIAGAIAGGIVGGIVGVGAIVVAVIYVRRISGPIRREAVTDERPQQVAPLQPPPVPLTPEEKLLMRSSPPPSGPPPVPPKLYDPSDPSTFPPPIRHIPPQGLTTMPHAFGYTDGGPTAQAVPSSFIPPNNSPSGMSTFAELPFPYYGLSWRQLSTLVVNLILWREEEKKKKDIGGKERCLLHSLYTIGGIKFGRSSEIKRKGQRKKNLQWEMLAY